MSRYVPVALCRISITKLRTVRYGSQMLARGAITAQYIIVSFRNGLPIQLLQIYKLIDLSELPLTKLYQKFKNRIIEITLQQDINRLQQGFKYLHYENRSEGKTVVNLAVALVFGDHHSKRVHHLLKSLNTIPVESQNLNVVSCGKIISSAIYIPARS